MNYVSPQEIALEISPKDLDSVKVTFINMPIREQAKPNVTPLGPTLLASRLAQYGAVVSIIDLNAYRIDDAIARQRNLPNGRTLTFDEAEELLRRTFDKTGEQALIGFSGPITTLKWQTEVAKMVRRLQPQALVVSGGGLATEFRSGLTPGSAAYNDAAASINQNMFTATAYPGTEMFDDPRVRELLADRFNLQFDRTTGAPISDQNFLNYVLELNDATKMLVNEDDQPLNFGAIPDEQFIAARTAIDNHQLFEILGM